jgi:hypothetical protein
MRMTVAEAIEVARKYPVHHPGEHPKGWVSPAIYRAADVLANASPEGKEALNAVREEARERGIARHLFAENDLLREMIADQAAELEEHRMYIAQLEAQVRHGAGV